jgi:hypothetical protein
MLSVRDFWRGFSQRQFHLGAVEGLPERLSYAALFDQLFGRLTRHRIICLFPRKIVIDCRFCDHTREASGNDVCETHIGILQGQFERRFSHSFQTKRIIAEKVCRLQLSFDPSDHEE